MKEWKYENPEAHKVESVSEVSQAQGEFLDWVLDRYLLAKWHEDETPFNERLVPVNLSVLDLLYEFHGIDKDAYELEKREMLKNMKELNDD